MDAFESGFWDLYFCMQPAIPTVPRGVEAELGQPPVEGAPMLTIFQFFEIFAHVVGTPRRVVGQSCQQVPILIVWIYGDHGVMGCTAAEAARAWV